MTTMVIDEQRKWGSLDLEAVGCSYNKDSDGLYTLWQGNLLVRKMYGARAFGLYVEGFIAGYHKAAERAYD